MTPSFLTPVRSGGLVVLAAVLVYANSLGNGFAYDDPWVVEQNPVVTEGRWAEAWEDPYWPQAAPGTGNYRPLTLLSFAAEWRLWDGSPAGYHAVSVAAHAAVSLLVFALLWQMVGTLGGLAGGLVFAVHPVHVEAVANVVGRAELYAAAAVVAAVLLYWVGAGARGWRGGARLAGLALLYAAGLASKETAVTLPGLLLLLELTVRHGEGGVGARLRRQAPVYLVLAAVLGTYLLVRTDVLGAVTGERAAAGLASLDTGERLLSALAVWPHYLRLMVAPADLVMDYQPGVIVPATGVDLRVVVGALLLASLLAGAFLLRRREPVVACGLGWFFVAVLPVSNLVVRADVLLAERTLYLPSVGLALVVAGLVPVLAREARGRSLRLVWVASAVALVALSARTVSRNPTWASTTTALNTLALEHPESFRALRIWSRIQEDRGDVEGAARAYEEALAVVPDDYQLAVEAGAFYDRMGRPDRARALFTRAVALLPEYPAAYRYWGQHLLRNGEGRAAHAVALTGLARSGADREVFAVLSESYVAGGDLEAALRARRAAVAQPGATRNDVLRMAELLDALGRDDEAAAVRVRAADYPDAPPPERIP